ncbi:putative lipase atg15 [Boothiomyces macroporosus]|uniref:triacylglycerol lipase n=1 Tax=Boothiomyces macroporosus TaxID=261099 RepID=A0AAD5UCW5_9FUNG|nr:putative lipase atg15 [Boothiomyces macroporosus]
MPDLKRIEREIRQCLQDKSSQVTVETVNDNLCHLKGTFKGPEDTCYAGGEFIVDIHIPDDYPFKPPKLISLQSLLCDAAPDDPQDAQVARHYLSDRPGFEKTAREWTAKYATGKIDPEFGLDQEAIQRICEMGFERSLVVKCLKERNVFCSFKLVKKINAQHRSNQVAMFESQIDHHDKYYGIKSSQLPYDQVLTLQKRRYHDLFSIEPMEFDYSVPDHTDPQTVLDFARMTFNSYYEPNDKSWVPIPGWNVSTKFGWENGGIRGYLFENDDQDTLIIVLKGTSLATPVGSGPTAKLDQLNTIYLAAKEWFPKHTNIWMAGHSLGSCTLMIGGALASLVALTNGIPSFAFESPGDLLYASRLGLLPSGDAVDLDKFLNALPIYHFGNDGDPIFLGECNGPTSSCYWMNYALESKCHIGKECTYKSSGKTDVRVQSSIQYHSIEYVIKNFLQNSDKVPECVLKPGCLGTECSGWKFEE